MKLPSFRRLLSTDYDVQYKQLLDRLSFTINSGIGSLYDALNRNLTLKDNLKGTYKEISVTVDADGIPTQTLGFPLDVSGTVSGIRVLRAENQNNSNTYPTGAPFINFTQNGTSVIINHITGLQAGQTYILNVFADVN